VGARLGEVALVVLAVGAAVVPVVVAMLMIVGMVMALLVGPAHRSSPFTVLVMLSPTGCRRRYATPT